MSEDRYDYAVGDLVIFLQSLEWDNVVCVQGEIGIVVALSPRMVHIASHGRANVVQVYWPKIQETDWEYDFFLVKFEEPDLTKKKK